MHTHPEDGLESEPFVYFGVSLFLRISIVVGSLDQLGTGKGRGELLQGVTAIGVNQRAFPHSSGL